MNKKFYIVNHTKWFQTQLTWIEDQKVLDIMRKTIGELPTTEQGFSDAIDRLYNSPNMIDFMETILKPSTSLYNRFRMWQTGMTPVKLLMYMTKSEIAVAIVDFFVFRREWLVDCANSQKNVISNLEKMVKKLPDPIRSVSLKYLSDSQRMIIN